MQSENWQLASLDALRGIAILGVLIVHSASWSVFPSNSAYVYDLVQSGQRGVQLFFVVSAFTLYLSFDNRRKERSPIRNFFLRRWFRLSPMFYLSLVCGLFVLKNLSAKQTLTAALYLNNFSPHSLQATALGAWSISTEAVFYLLLPFAFRYLTRSTQTTLLVLLCEVCRRVALYLVKGDYSSYLYVSYFGFFPANFGVFALGITAYFLWRDYLDGRIVGEPARQWSLGLLLLTLAFFIESPPASDSILIFGSFLCVLFMVALLLYPWRMLVNRFTVLLGKISYSFYLIHFYVGGLVQRILLSVHSSSWPAPVQYVMTMCLVFAVSFPSAWLTWRYIELPGIRLGKRLIDHLESRHVGSSWIGEQF